jgi:hypothetical protein
MLTNPHETQLVQSLGVRIGPAGGEPRSSPGPGCPFAEVAKGLESPSAEEIPWTPEAASRLERIPEFVRPMARAGIERFARERGYERVDEKVLEEARGFFGM